MYSVVRGVMERQLKLAVCKGHFDLIEWVGGILEGDHFDRTLC